MSKEKRPERKKPSSSFMLWAWLKLQKKKGRCKSKGKKIGRKMPLRRRKSWMRKESRESSGSKEKNEKRRQETLKKQKKENRIKENEQKKKARKEKPFKFIFLNPFFFFLFF